MMYFIWKNICQNENKLCLTFYLTRDLELGIMSSSRTRNDSLCLMVFISDIKMLLC